MLLNIPHCLLLIKIIIIFTLTSHITAKRRKNPKFRPKAAGVQRYDPLTVNYKSWREQLIVKKLLHTYHSAVRPIGNIVPDGPVEVLTSLYLRSINRVSEADMEFVAQFRFQQEWFDSRLKFEDTLFRSDFLNLAVDQIIWIPDTFFQNEKDGRYHFLDQPNKFVRVRSDGKIVYNRRLTLWLACTMDLLRYPMDVQTCSIEFASYAYTTKDIRYIWNEEPIHVHRDANKDLPNFEFSRIKNGSCTSITSTGEYSCLKIEMRLERVFSFFLLALYIPSGMLVAVSWVSYWIDWRSTAARVPLAIVTLLTMITQSHAVQANLPPVSYTKAIDVWVGACVIFIFFSLIEYAVVNYTGMREERLRQKHTMIREQIMEEQGKVMEGVEANRKKGDRLRRTLRNLIKASDAFSSSARKKSSVGSMYSHTVSMQNTSQTSPTSMSPFNSPEKVALLRRRSRPSQLYTEDIRLAEESSSHAQSSGMMQELPWTENKRNENCIRLKERKKIEVLRLRWRETLSPTKLRQIGGQLCDSTLSFNDNVNRAIDYFATE